MCRPCGKLLMNENVAGLQAKSGPAYHRWLRGYARMLERAAS